MMPRELADTLARIGAPIAPLTDHGLFLDEYQSVPYVEIGLFAEHLLSWTLEIVDALQRTMLSSGNMTPGARLTLSPAEETEREYCRALARDGEYPCASGTGGLPALYGRITELIHLRRGLTDY